jgi:hypothetical protein
VASAAQFSVVLTEDARVFTFGRTADSRLGHGDFDYKKEFEICTPMEVKTLNPVFLSSDASWTQPAPHVTTEMNTAVTTKMPDRVVAISVAEAHALAYTSAGRAFGWGSGDLGQLGYGEGTFLFVCVFARYEMCTLVMASAYFSNLSSCSLCRDCCPRALLDPLDAADDDGTSCRRRRRRLPALSYSRQGRLSSVLVQREGESRFLCHCLHASV